MIEGEEVEKQETRLVNRPNMSEWGGERGRCRAVAVVEGGKRRRRGEAIVEDWT